MRKKKSKSLLDRILFLVNSLVATLLLLAYLLPFISPAKAPSLAVLSLFVPVLIIANLLFAIFWIIRLKRQFLLSSIVILLGLGHLGSLYQISGKKVLLNDDLSIMSYNVKLFNHYGWNKNDSTATKTFDFILKKKPDVLLIQEFYEDQTMEFPYPHKYIKTKSKSNIFGLAIYSKYPMINSGSLDLEDSANNIIFSDIVKDKDTIRIYNVHFESLKLKPEEENFGEQDSDKLFKRMKIAFKKQAEQTEKFLSHESQWQGKSIVCGDFNNTAFSWIYRQISKNRQDAFKVAGQGTGRSFDFTVPLRIDFILPDNSFEVNHFETFNIDYSDHFPILAKLQIKATEQ